MNGCSCDNDAAAFLYLNNLNLNIMDNFMLRFRNNNTGECFAIESSDNSVFDMVDELTLHGAEVIDLVQFEKYENENEMEQVKVNGMLVIQPKYKVLLPSDEDKKWDEFWANLN